ncbi:hypothetical protein CW706_06255 [Candidatus Bathyarchaeota archaeon]|nr:MAG: hypothetical protein CW706_06255 [Candidatus Bathyarchaeota archaeon]
MRASKLILIGIDSFLLDFVEKFVSKGFMPNIKQLMDTGSYGYALPSMPTFTPPNWTTIATGADPSVHGITGWIFDSRNCKAEHLWTVAAKAGKKSVLLRYPCSWPSTHENVSALGNGSPHHSIGVIEEATAYTLGRIYRYSGGLHGTFESTPVYFTSAQDWKNPIESKFQPMEAELKIITEKNFEPIRWWALAYASSDVGYDRILIAHSKDCLDSVCHLRIGEWSDFIKIDLRMEGKTSKGAFKFKLVELSNDLSKFSLFRTQIHALSDFTDPPNLGDELIKNVGPYLDNPSRFCLAHGWYETYFEELKEHVNWLVKAAKYLKENHGWDLLFTQCHSPDYVQHECWAGIDPLAPGYEPEKENEYWEIFSTDYKIMDEFIGGLKDLADEETIVVVVSDHGHIPNIRVIFLANILQDKGLLVYDEMGNIDISKSLIRGFTHDGILLNTKRRYKDGIILEEDYLDIVDQVINVLLSIRDGDRYVVNLAIKGSEASALGASEAFGDVIFCPRPGYTLSTKPAEKLSLFKDGYIGLPDPRHGMWGGAESTHNGLPSSRVSIGTNMAMFLISGPKIKEGYRCERPIWLKDIAPTIAYLMGLPTPKNANGRILNEIIEE